MKILKADSPRAKALIEYSSKVVAALEILHGPSHMEVSRDCWVYCVLYLNVSLCMCVLCVYLIRLLYSVQNMIR